MKKIVLILVMMSSWVLAHEHQPHVTVARDSGYTMMTDVASFQLRKCGAGLYAFNMEPTDDLDAYQVGKNIIVYVKEGDVLYIKGANATINVAWTKD